MPQLEQAVTQFMTGKNFKVYIQGSYAESTVNNLLQMLLLKYGKEKELDSDKMDAAVRETVKGYSSNKTSAVGILKKFLVFLKKEYGFDPEISFPPIDISNSFERLMYIAKALQSPDTRISDLEDILWVSKRTIEDDLARLRGNDPIQIMGKPFIIDETTRKDDTLKFSSTAHPLFLTFNLTQVIATLKGLKAMSREPALKNYAMYSAVSIWMQLSPYAKERIFYVMENLIPDDVSWYRDLEMDEEGMFRTEQMSRRGSQGASVLMDCIKNGKTCIIEYPKDEDEENPERDSVFYTGCTVVPRSYDGDNVQVVCDQGEKTIMLNRILKSSYDEESLI